MDHGITSTTKRSPPSSQSSLTNGDSKHSPLVVVCYSDDPAMHAETTTCTIATSSQIRSAINAASFLKGECIAPRAFFTWVNPFPFLISKQSIDKSSLDSLSNLQVKMHVVDLQMAPSLSLQVKLHASAMQITPSSFLNAATDSDASNKVNATQSSSVSHVNNVGRPRNKSWSSLFASSHWSENCFVYHEDSIFSKDNVLRIKAFEEEIDEGEEHQKNSLVIYFVGSRPPSCVVKNQVNSIWNPMGSLEVFAFGSGVLYF